MKADFHVHTSFCDGSASPAEMAAAAFRQGLEILGFSGHSHTAFDESWCMSRAGTEAYRAEVSRLREEYAGRMEILCGVEQDYYSEAPTGGYDYVIGSVHYLKADGEYLPVDESAGDQLVAAEKHFSGDLLSFAEAYFETVCRVPEISCCRVIGHFDLIAKFNEGGILFDESNPRYTAAWKMAADRLLPSGLPFEVNTGAISRGYRSVPYPAPPILKYLAERGARFLLSSDSHRPETLCYGFDHWQRELLALGGRIAESPLA
ncbi:MAG: histidinol-phosphatase [Oscillospiraceae bacterium]|nr:histidinol-phosphatase [Oscillospiraceae bacterium]